MLAQGSTILQLTFEGNSEADAELDMELQVVQEADSSVFLINSGQLYDFHSGKVICGLFIYP